MNLGFLVLCLYFIIDEKISGGLKPSATDEIASKLISRNDILFEIIGRKKLNFFIKPLNFKLLEQQYEQQVQVRCQACFTYLKFPLVI
jgi:hypothetical protein